MNILIESPFALSDKDKAIIESKINYLKKYESRIIQANVFFKKGGGTNPNTILSEIRILVPGNDLFAERSDVDAIKAFSSSYSSIKRQVKERRKKLNDHKSPIKEINEIVNNTY
jgi:putative sigma-54 modulation protein